MQGQPSDEGPPSAGVKRASGGHQRLISAVVEIIKFHPSKSIRHHHPAAGQFSHEPLHLRPQPGKLLPVPGLDQRHQFFVAHCALGLPAVEYERQQHIPPQRGRFGGSFFCVGMETAPDLSSGRKLRSAVRSEIAKHARVRARVSGQEMAWGYHTRPGRPCGGLSPFSPRPALKLYILTSKIL